MRNGSRGSQTRETRTRISAGIRATRAAWTPEEREAWAAKRRKPRGFDHRPVAMTYSGVHLLMRRLFPKTGRCEWCGRTDRRTQYALAVTVPTLNRADWLELCGSCHAAFDGRLTKAWASRRVQANEEHAVALAQQGPAS